MYCLVGKSVVPVLQRGKQKYNEQKQLRMQLMVRGQVLNPSRLAGDSVLEPLARVLRDGPRAVSLPGDLLCSNLGVNTHPFSFSP